MPNNVRMRRRAYAIVLLCAGLSPTQWGVPTEKPAALARRIVIVKVDGLPGGVMERWVNETDPASGKSRLPWIHRVFVENGAWLRNFYVRGISLSAPSWAMLDTGQHTVIRGNAEFDRYTGRVYDYLNFFPFYLNYAMKTGVDMRGVEVMDESGLPLLIDRFLWEQHYQGVQLYQRGVRWDTLRGILGRRFARNPRELFNEWQSGFEMSKGLSDQVEHEIALRIAGKSVLYLDYFFTDYDHTAHLTSDDAAEFDTLKKLDQLIGRLWNEIQASPLARETLLVLVSDHGMNGEPGIYSQGYSLIRFFGSAAGGGHHVVTNRHPMTEYKLKGLDPFVSEVVTPSPDSFYLRDQAEAYPTAMLDLDGNERASVYLRNSDLNSIHILARQLARGDLSPASRKAAAKAFEELIERHRGDWTRTFEELEDELAAVHRWTDRQRARVAALPKRWTKVDWVTGPELEGRRARRYLTLYEEDERSYSEYLATLKNLLALKPEQIENGKLRIESLITRRAMGDPNSIYDLQNYAVSAQQRINYFSSLVSIRVRNNVQGGIGPNPVDFVAVKVPRDALAAALPEQDRPDQDGIWLYKSDNSQALILTRKDPGRGVLLRYVPVRGLRQDSAGRLHFETQPWVAGLPLELFEDPKLDTPGERSEWLSSWHTDREWLQATHRTRYSNGVVALEEYYSPYQLGASIPLFENTGADEALLRRFQLRKLRMKSADLTVFASDHWNFNARGFNPGGNHGAFFRASTHSVWMLAGPGVPPGISIDAPYDSLSFIPTLRQLLGAPADELSTYPGRPISW